MLGPALDFLCIASRELYLIIFYHFAGGLIVEVNGLVNGSHFGIGDLLNDVLLMSWLMLGVYEWVSQCFPHFLPW